MEKPSINSVKELASKLDLNTCSDHVETILKMALSLNKLNTINKKLKYIIDSSDNETQIEDNIYMPTLIQKHKFNMKKIDHLKSKLIDSKIKKIFIKINNDTLNITEIESDNEDE